MSAEIITLQTLTTLDVPVERVLAGATALDEVVVAGFTSDGEFYFAASSARSPEILWVLERAKHELLKGK